MNVDKTTATVQGDHIALSMPFMKVDHNRRTVKGFASANNLDKQGHVITPEANRKAFGAWARNIREMHSNIAAGRAVEVREESLVDASSGEAYTGFYIEAYVSKGAESTWEKVLDGTLTGFSIGGVVKEKEFEKNDSGELIMKITDYELNEVSLVDVPANPLANILSVEKAETGMLFKGIAADTKFENVFYCEKDDVAFLTENSTHKCNACDHDLPNIGWVESIDGKGAEVKKLIDGYLGKDAEVETIEKASSQDVDTDTGGETLMATEEMTVEETVEKAVEVEETVEAVEETETEVEVEKAVEISEVPEEDDVDIHDVVSKAVAEAVESALASVVETLTKAQEAEAEGATDEQSTLNDLVGELSKTLADVSEKLSVVEERLGSLESKTATKKSFDPVDEGEKTSKSMWGGAFLAADTL